MSTTSIDCKLNRKKFKTKVYDSRLSLAVFIQILSKKKLYSQQHICVVQDNLFISQIVMETKIS